MEISVNFVLDDGYLRRECPNCEREFKWHHGPIANRPADAIDPPLYHCPYCGLTGDSDAWWTRAQLSHMEDVVQGRAPEIVDDMLEDAFRSTKGLSFTRSGSMATTPSPPVEPHDMVAVEAPCHPWEPIKIAEDWRSPLHCIVCGAQFAV